MERENIMATYKLGTFAIKKTQVSKDAFESELVLDTGILETIDEEENLSGQYRLTNVFCGNFSELKKALASRPCLYPHTRLNRRGLNFFYKSTLYTLPVDKSLFDGDTVEVDETIALINVFILLSGAGDNIWDSYFLGRKIQFYVPLDDPLAVIPEALAKTFGGEVVFSQRICSPLYDDIPINFVSGGKLTDSEIKGSDMATYKLPWFTANSSNTANDGRMPDWNKTVRENNFKANDILYCRLYKQGNKLTAYGGGGKPDYKALGIDILLDTVLGHVGGKM